MSAPSTASPVLFADGTAAWAILELHEPNGAPPQSGGTVDSTELTGLGVFMPDGETSFDGYPDFLSRLGKNAEQVYPYRFRILPALGKLSIMINGAVGWSRLQTASF